MADAERPALLIVDDDPLIAEALSYFLERDFLVITADSRDAAVAAVRQLPLPPPLALVDLGLPPYPHRPDEGFALITELLAHAPEMRIFVLSGQDETANARHARTLGALEFIAKPAEPMQLRNTLLDALRLPAASGSSEASGEQTLLGESPPARALRAQINQYSEAPFPVLIEGESGTGKELVAQSVHLRSPRRERPYLTLNCAAIAPSLIESLLFGHARGSFTGATGSRTGFFEDASDGTLFLDEIGELPLDLQPKLLRVLENGEYQRVGETLRRQSHARIIAATNRDLRTEIREGRFRADLYHRLSVFTLQVPPLRELGEDRLLMLEHYRRLFAHRSGRPAFRLASEARTRWSQYAFPGNVRELRNIVIRLQTKYPGDTVAVAALDAELESGPTGGIVGQSTDTPPTALGDPLEVALHDLQSGQDFELNTVLSRWEASYIDAALRLSHGNMSQAARRLGINRSTLYSRMDALGMARGHQSTEN